MPFVTSSLVTSSDGLLLVALHHSQDLVVPLILMYMNLAQVSKATAKTL